MEWFTSMLKYSTKCNNNVDKLLENVDLELIPKVIEKIVLDKIDRKYILNFFFIYFKYNRFCLLFFRNGY